MHARTRKTLLGLGFDTELIEAIARNSHTVEALRSLSKDALRKAYTDAQIALIQAKIVRQPIPEDVVERVLASASGACCYCEDGLASRPYQIHHIEPYAATQDHSEENLLVVCPNHHAVIHEANIPATAQKHARRKWHALVALAERYRALGVSFPFGSFVAVDYVGQPSASELVREIRVAPPTALAVSENSLGFEVRDAVLKACFALLLGRSGDGKTTLALGAGGLLQRAGWQVYRYRPPTADSRRALREILEFIATAVRESVVILDDVNTWMSAHDLEEVAAAVRGKASVIATWTRDGGGDDSRVEARLPRWISAEWRRQVGPVKSFLTTHEAEVVPALQALEEPTSIRRIGLGMFDESLVDRMSRYEQEAKTISEFMFLLRGGTATIRKELAVMVDRDRSDVPVLYAAIEQIAGFERAVTPEEAAASLAGVNVGSGLPSPTPGWVVDVFRRECARRRMQQRRDAYTTIHRDWGRSLICAALGDPQAREAVTALLGRDFDTRTRRPIRTMRLWSWLWYDDQGTPYVRDWASHQRADDWKAFVGTAAEAGLDDVGLVASRLHLLFHNDKWEKVLGEVFSCHEGILAQRVREATPESWPSLRSLFTMMDHACPDVAAKVIQQWPPGKAAALLGETHPDYYDSAWWFLSGVKKHSLAWCAEVGKNIRWNRISESLGRVRPGDAEAVEKCQSILGRLEVPLLRSHLSRYIDAICECLAAASISELHIGFGYDLSFVLRFYPEAGQRIAAAIDPQRLANQLAVASPRCWRAVGEMAILLAGARKVFYQEMIEALDLDRFVANVARHGAACPYELRCLLWVLRRGGAFPKSDTSWQFTRSYPDLTCGFGGSMTSFEFN